MLIWLSCVVCCIDLYVMVSAEVRLGSQCALFPLFDLRCWLMGLETMWTKDILRPFPQKLIALDTVCGGRGIPDLVAPRH